jgi:hypothetical protein
MRQSILADTNVTQTAAEKELKCNSLCVEIQRMWNMTCMVIPVITGATGIATVGLKENL